MNEPPRWTAADLEQVRSAAGVPGASVEDIGELLDVYGKRGLKNPVSFAVKGANGLLARDLRDIAGKRRKAETARVVEQLREGPECEHGVSGGASAHPDTGQPLCPVCRKKSGKGARAAGQAGTGNAAGEERAGDSPSRRLMVTPASQIKPKPVLWGWQDRLPAAHLSLIPGREGIGKSLFLIWMAARLTRGMLPGCYHGRPRAVFYCATEDSWQHTIVPRLIAAGADLDRVFRVDVESVEASDGASTVVELTLPRDCELLGAEAKRLEVAMIALDPLMSVIDRHVDTHNDRELRTVLEPVGRLASVTGCMIVGLAHFNKSGNDDPLNLVTGSRAFTAFGRAVIAIARDPDSEDGQCIISQVKNNLGRLNLPNLTYVIEPVTIGTDDGDCETATLLFTGESQKSVRDILADTGTAADRSERAECADWLRTVLADGPRRSKEVEEEATGQGFSIRTLYRARSRLGVKADQRSAGTGKKGGNEWWLSLPAKAGSQ